MGTPIGLDLNSLVFPLFRVRDGSRPDPIENVGTGFLIADQLLITCWHCVRAPLEVDEYYAAAAWNGSSYGVLRLSDVRQSRTGMDIALAKVKAHSLVNLLIHPPIQERGEDVWAFGYPHTSTRAMESGKLQFELAGRYLEGYVTRTFTHKPDDFSDAPVYELDMRTPSGLSGAPLFKRINETKDGLTLVGMVFGSSEVGTIDQFRREDPETREITPEIVRVDTFGLAHVCESLTKTVAEG